MKKNTDFILTLFGIALLAGIIAFVIQSRKPDPVVLDFSELPELSKEHQLVAETLKDPESTVDALPTSDSPLSTPAAPLPVAGAPLPVAWDSQPAPTIDEVELSPALQRSLASSSSLRTEAYTNPSSEFNLQRIEELRAIRQQRHAD